MTHALRRAVRRRLVNPLVRATLRSPGHRLLSGAVMLLTYRGRRSGREFTIPVQYARDGARLVVLVGDAERKVWWRNLRGGASVRVLIRGSWRRGRAVVLEDPTGTTTALRIYLDRFPRAARTIRRADGVVLVLVEPATGPGTGRDRGTP